MRGNLTHEQAAQLRGFVAGATASTIGRRWLALLRPVAPELVRLYSGNRVVQERVDHALAAASRLVESPQTRVTDDVLHAAGAALTAIATLAGPELGQVTEAARNELRQAGGRTLREIFGL
jgi:hypothetical protein